MYISHLQLINFRSYEHVDLALEPGTTALIGPNGVGKTNIVEAIGFLSSLASHRVATDKALIRRGCDNAIVRCRAVHDTRASSVEIQINESSANRARVNGSDVPRVRDVLGLVKTVLFAPEDLALVKGDPDGRRRFLDELLTSLRPRFASVRSDYERILKQRRSLLKTAKLASRSSAGRDLRTLDVWDENLAKTGAELMNGRMTLIRELAPLVSEAYEQVSAASGKAELSYRSTLGESSGEVFDTEALQAQLLAAMANARDEEIDRGTCLIGPHRDDCILTLDDFPAKGYASHGESWSFALALKLASYRLLTQPTDVSDRDEPVLILDDVFAELDVSRRERLVELIAPAQQVLITAAVENDVPQELRGRRIVVREGGQLDG